MGQEFAMIHWMVRGSLTEKEQKFDHGERARQYPEGRAFQAEGKGRADSLKWGYVTNSHILNLKSIPRQDAKLYHSPTTEKEDFAPGKNLPPSQFCFRPNWIKFQKDKRNRMN